MAQPSGNPGSIAWQFGYALRTLKPTIVILFYPAAFFVLFPWIMRSNAVFSILWTIANGVTVVPHELGHFMVLGITVLLSILRIGFDRNLLFFIATLAGTIGYTLPPLMLAIHYARKKDSLASGAYLGFLAVSVANMASYAGSTADQVVMNGGPDDLLRPGVHHDWYAMLTYLDSLNSANNLSDVFQATASIVAMASLALLAAWACMKAMALIQKKDGAASAR